MNLYGCILENGPHMVDFSSMGEPIKMNLGVCTPRKICYILLSLWH
jgi:hypothetical protein